MASKTIFNYHVLSKIGTGECAMSRGIYFIALMTFSLLLRGQYGPVTPQTIVSRFGGSVVLIVREISPNAVGMGSGFLIAPDVVATNFHVVRGAQNLFIKFPDERVVGTDTLLAFDEERDIALIKLPNPQAPPPVPLGNSEEVRQGEDVVVIGNPRGILENSVSNGLVSAIRKISNSFTLLQISAPVSRGSSGGPVFDTRGEVIGVVVGTMEEGQNLNFAIPSNYVTRMLRNPHEVRLPVIPAREGAQRGSEGRPRMDGSWVATFADEEVSGKLYFNLVDSRDGRIAGTYTSSLGGGGTVLGVLNADTLLFELRQSLRDCPGSYVGRVVVEGDRGIGTYSGQDCRGDHGTGTVTLARSSAEGPPPPPTTEQKSELKVEYGDVSELRAIKTIFVYSGADMEVRQNIERHLEKYSGLRVVEAAKDADVMLAYGANTFSLGSYTHVWSDVYGNVYGTNTPRAGVEGFGFAAVFVPPSTLRVLWSFRAARTTYLQRRPSTNFARDFIKVLKGVRGEK